MVAAWRGHSAHLAAVNPLLQRGIADAKSHGGFSGFERHGGDFIRLNSMCIDVLQAAHAIESYVV